MELTKILQRERVTTTIHTTSTTKKTLKNETGRINIYHNNNHLKELEFKSIKPGVDIFLTKDNKFANLQMMKEERDLNPELVQCLISRSDKRIDISSDFLSEVLRSETYRKLQKEYFLKKNSYENKVSEMKKSIKKVKVKLEEEFEYAERLFEKVFDLEDNVERLEIEFYEIKRKNYEFKCELDYRRQRNRYLREGRREIRRLYYEEESPLLDVDNMTYEELLELEERVGKENIGLTSKAIEKLKTCKVREIITKSTKESTKEEEEEEEIICCICCESVEKEENVFHLECQHIHHYECLEKWLKVKRSCPLCKNEISE